MPSDLATVYRLIFTQIFSLIGSRMTGIAVGIWVFSQTGDASPILVASFFAELPQMAGGLFTGLLADKWDRKRIIMLGDAGSALGTILLLLTISSGLFQLWHLYLAMFIQGVFNIIQSPAADASIAFLVPESERDRANGIRNIGFPLAGVIAPALGGLLYSIGGLPLVMAIDLLTFMVAVVVVFNLHIPMPPPSQAGIEASDNFWTEFLGGWRFLWQRPILLAVVIYLAFVFFLINGPLDLAIPYLSTIASDEFTVGLLLGAMNLGAFAGAMVIAARGNIRHRMWAILLAYLLHGVMLILFGITRDVWLIAFILFWVMFPLPFAGALFNTILQTRTPPDLQGRIFAATGQLFTLTTPFSFLITAYLVDEVLEPLVNTPQWQFVTPIVGAEKGSGMGLILVTIGIIIVIVTLVMIAIPRVRNLEQDLPRYQETTNS